MLRLKPALILLGLFGVISVVVRYPLLDRPLSAHHENNTAHTLITLKIWDEEGIAKHHFLPVCTFSHAGDRFVSNFGGIPNREGSYYYTSYPPFGFILPYAVFKALHVPLTVMSVQLWNIVLHLISAFLIFGLIQQVVVRDETENFLAPTLGALAFLFCPGPLWFFSNVYFVENLAIPFWLGTLWSYLAIRQHERYRSIPHLVTFGLLNFFCTYTEWIGVFFSVCLFGSLLFPLSKFRANLKMKWPLLLVLSLSVSAAVALTLFQYASIMGWLSYYRVTTQKFAQRSGLFSKATAKEGISLRGFFTIAGYYLLGLFPAVLGVALLAFRRRRPHRLAPWGEVLFLTTVPLLLFHLVFFNYSRGHDFSALKGIIPLSLLVGFFANQTPLLWPARIRWVSATLGLLTLSVTSFYYFNLWPNLSSIDRVRAFGFASRRPLDLGRSLAKIADPSEVILMKGEGAQPPSVIYYAHRNMISLSPDEDPLAVMRAFGKNRGVLVTVNHFWKVIEVDHLHINTPSAP